MYALVNISTFFGKSEFWVRLPSALFGVAGLVTFYFLAKLTLGRLTALVAVGLLAFSPIHIWYSQDARYYTQLCTLGMAAVYFFYAFLTADKPRITLWVGLLLTTVAALYTHLFAGWIIVAQVLFAVYFLFKQMLRSGEKAATLRRDARIKALLLLGALLLLAVFTYPITLRLVETLQTGVSSGGEGMARLRFPPASPAFLTATFLSDMVQRFSGGRLLLFFMLPFFAVGLAATWRQKRDVAVLMLCLMTAPFLTTFFLETEHGIAFKYFFYLLPAFLLLAAEGLVATARAIERAAVASQRANPTAGSALVSRRLPVGQAILIGLLLCAALMSVRPIAQVFTHARINDWRSIAAFLEENVQPEDIVLTERWGKQTLGYYLPPNSDIIVMDNTEDRLQGVRNQAERVWLVGLEGPAEQPRHYAFQKIADSEWQDPRWVYDYGQRPDILFPISEPAASVYIYERPNPAPLIDFTDIDDAQWTEVSYRHVEPGRQTSANLTLAAAAPRVLAVRYFDHSGKDFQVLVDGEVIGSVTGGSLGGWQRWQHQLPSNAGDSVHVTIAAVGPSAIGVDMVELAYGAPPALQDDLPIAALTLNDQGTILFDQAPSTQQSPVPPHLLAPGDEIPILLSIPDQAARLLTITAQGLSGQSIEIKANGYHLATLAGHEWGGGPLEEQVVVPGGLGERVLIQLRALGPDASRLVSVALEPIE
jgi:hypothetical protein